jgi:branched-chain amino acid transport system substrate-binding protein
MKKFIVPLLTAVMVVSIILAGCVPGAAPAPPAVETVKFGYVGPLTGPAALWGINGMRGMELYCDDVNARGGIEIGGKTYMVQMIAYDDKATPSETLAMTRKLVLEDKVDVVSDFLNADAAGQFCTEQKILQFTITAGCLHPDFPYMVAAGNTDPEFMPITVMYMKEHMFPEMQRIAITSQDDQASMVWRAWYAAQAELMGMDVVYNKGFSLDTVDFAPIVSAMLATNPDVLCWDGSYPDFNGLLTAQAYAQGSNLPMMASSHNLWTTIGKAPLDWLEKVKYVQPWPTWDQPELGEQANRIYELYRQKYGIEGWKCDVGLIYDQCRYWEQAAKIAGSIESDAVIEALLHNQLQCFWGGADAMWYGKDITGTNNYIMPYRWPVCYLKDHEDVIDGWVDLKAWWSEYGAGIMDKLAAQGLMWYQRGE